MSKSCIDDEIPEYKCVNVPIKDDMSQRIQEWTK